MQDSYKKLFQLVALCLALAFSSLGKAKEIPSPKTIELNGVTLEYLDVGSGTPVVFVHGAVSDMRTWGDYLEPISQDYRFVAYSRRYYGQQDWPAGDPDYDHEVHAEDLAALIRSLGAGPVHLVTWSSSGSTATYLAARYPDLVKSLIQFEPNVGSAIMDGITDQETYKIASDDWNSRWSPVDALLESGDERHALRKMIEMVFELSPGEYETLPAATQEMTLHNARTLKLIFSSEQDTPITCAMLGKIQVPSLVVLGLETHRAWTMEVERLAECMPNASLHIMPGVNHAGPITGKDRFTQLIKSFIEDQG